MRRAASGRDMQQPYKIDNTRNVNEKDVNKKYMNSMKQKIKLMLAAAVFVLAAVAAAGLVPAESAAGEADGGQTYTSGDYKYSLDENDNAVITKYNGSGTELCIPDDLDGHRVTGIGDRAFEYKRSIAAVEMPEGITYIGERAFHECTGLKEVILPDSLEKIEEYAFAACDRLREIRIPNGVKRLEEGTFIYCMRMKDIELPDKLEYIGYGAVWGCRKLTEINIPDSVTDIGSYAFSGCSSLKRIEIPYGVTTLPEHMMQECSGITEVVLPDTVKTIGRGTFAKCENLKKINIPESTTSIGTSAFARCEALGKIKVPASVTRIGKNTFKTQKCGLVIYCGCGSYAEKYALDNDLEFAGSDYSSKVTPARTYKNGKIIKKCRRCGKTLINRTIPRASTLGLYATEYRYTGSRIEPRLKIKDETGKKLMRNTDYKLKYVTDGKRIGKQTVKIVYRGKYTGTRKLSYRISSSMKKPSLKASAVKKGKVKLSWNKVSGAKGYKIYVKEPGSSRYRCRLTKDVMVRSVTHKGLKRGKTYRYKIRAYKITGGTTEYGPYSTVKTVKIK